MSDIGLRSKTNYYAAVLRGIVSDLLKNSRLNWKLKISNTADNAGITQSQARDTTVFPLIEAESHIQAGL